MKFFYTITTALLVGVVAIAQNTSKTLAPHLSPQKAGSQVPKIIHRSPSTRQTLGDTVFVFDGSSAFDWNKTLPTTFDFKLEDIDSYTIDPKLQPSFGTKGSFSFFYEVDPASNLHYNHPDSVFFGGATSYFAPPGKANDWFEMGPILVPNAGGTLKWRHNFPNKSFRDGYEILVNTTGLGSTNFTNTPIFSVADNDPLTAGDTVGTPHLKFYQYSANVSSYAGQGIYIAVHHNANDQLVLFITDIILTEGYGASVNENNNIIASLQNMPNPASDNTTISYSLKETANVELSLFDITGKKLSGFNQGTQPAGNHQLKLDLSNISSGMYFYTISAGEDRITNKMSVVK